MITPFSIQIKDLTNFGADRAVDFFRRLLWAESSRVGISRDLLDIPDCINIGDGGIDAYINDANPHIPSIIPKGNSGFQIKSGDLGPKACKRELHKNGDLNKPLKPEIQKLLVKKGTYILILFADITYEQKRKRIEAIKEDIDINGFPSAEIKVYSANQISHFAEQYPSIVASVNQRIECLSYKLWSEKADIRSPTTFVYDEERRNIINNIRETLRIKNTQIDIIRIQGLSGIGKSRLVFESLSPNDLSNRVIYINSAETFLNSSIFWHIQKKNDLSAIIVIDECSTKHHDEIVGAFSEKGSNQAFITLSQEFERISAPTKTHKLNALSKEEICKIIEYESPDLPKNVVERLSKFADGYPRIAVLLLKSYLRGTSSAEEFIEISDENLINRLIGGNIDLNSDYFVKTKRVLTGLSLFKKIGIKKNVENESRWLAEYLEIGWNDFIDIIQKQKIRGILQGDYFLYVTPFILRLYLIKEWWEKRGYTENILDELSNSIPKEFRRDLFSRFIDHTPYIHTSFQGREFLRKILGDEGLFSDGTFLANELGADFFLKITEADPYSALDRLKKTIGSWTNEKLLKFTTGRRQVVWALERIVIWRKLFQDGARILLSLAAAENETWSNNASGVFIELFSPAPGHVAPTEAPPEERFPILKEAFESNSKEKIQLAIKASDHALESRHFVRTVGTESQALRPEPKLWFPETYGEIFNHYRQIWEYLVFTLKKLDIKEQKQVIEILLNRAINLSQIANLAEMVLSSIEKLKEYNFVDKRQLLAGVIRFIRYSDFELDNKIRAKWLLLRDILIGTDFPSLMSRYVSMDIFEDRYDPEGKQVEAAKLKVKELAKKAHMKPSLLDPELKWLMTVEAKNGFLFGYELGKIDHNMSLLNKLLDAQKKSEVTNGVLCLGGYFKSLFEKDINIWENQIDILSLDLKMAVILPELIWRSGQSDKTDKIILNLATKGVIGWENFRIFIYGGYIYHLSESNIKSWIRFLIDKDDINSVYTALELFEIYYSNKSLNNKLPKKLTENILFHPNLFINTEVCKLDTMVEYSWTDIAKLYVDIYPSSCLNLAKKIFSHFGDEGTIVGRYHSYVEDVLKKIIQIKPLEIWNLASKYLNPPLDTRSWNIKDWIQRSDLLSSIPFSEIWKWIDENISQRAKIVANFAPKFLSAQEDKTNLTRELLIRYGEREDVRSSLRANFFTDSWSGYASSHYSSKKERLIYIRKQEIDKNILIWLDEMIKALELMIEKSKMDEERQDF